MIHEHALRYAIGFAILGLAVAIGGFYADGYLSGLLASLAGVPLSASLALVLINIFLDKKSRKIAAGPLMSLVGEPITIFHNDLVIDLGRNEFGIPQFQKIVDAYNNSQGNPQILSKAERLQYNTLIEANLPAISAIMVEIDKSLSDLIAVLGWSYDAKIVSAALTCKKNITGFRSIINPQEDDEKLKRIEYYLDTDTSSAAVIMTLASILESNIVDQQDARNASRN